ncbi:Flp family type IVb pilin [Actinomadura violacea]|uniref:Uncharacterized protein n=1 Tax=Actinomadura violacea TaxID=2819934 RepID=A0ABS3RS19_9ACTN|nr:hypothetical protein [Actinomadura violacea]MBO2458859.1 hypothetical protein [Actinomadura violacea]
MLCRRWERARDDSGATGIEYAALVLVSIAVVIGVLASVIPGALTPKARNAVCSAFQGKGCTVSAPAGDDGGPGTGGGTGTGTGDGDAPATGRPAGDGGKSAPRDGWGPQWNKPFAGQSPVKAALGGFGHQVGGFFKGVGSFFKDAGEGLWGGVWGDLTGLKDLVVHPVNSAKGLWWAVTHPTQSVPLLVWDDKSREDWRNGKKVRAVFRGVWNVGSWFIPYYDIGKGVSKIGKLGKVADEAGKAGKLSKAARLAEEAEEAAARARKAARSGDVPAARKAAADARKKADDADQEARRAGCKAVGLGPPRPAALFGRMAAVPAAFPARLTAALPAARAGGECGDAEKARKAADEAERQLRTAERAQKIKEIDDALAAKRYEDADGLSDELEKMAGDAEQRAAKDPTPENRKEAQDARADADRARNKIIDKKIAENAASPEANVRVPAEVARELRSIVRNFEKKYGPNGKDGEIDIETNKSIIEVANGKNAKGKVSQATRNTGNPITNPSGKPIIIYAPNMKYGAIKNLRLKTNATVVQNMDELKQALRDLGEPVP